MSSEKDLIDAVNDIKVWLAGAGTIVAVISFAFREVLMGAFEKFGDWVATKLLNKKKRQHLKDKAAKADERGQLHAFMAEEIYKVNKRLDECDKRHKERDHKDIENAKLLIDCNHRREELEVKTVKLVGELRSAAVEGAALVHENTQLRSKLGRG